MSQCFLSNWVFLLIITSSTVSLFGQTEIPQEVRTTFNEMFPTIEYVEWEQDGEEYMAFFEQSQHETEAYFLENGKWLQTSTFLVFVELPAAAQTFIEENYELDLIEFDSIVRLITASFTQYTVNFETQEEGFISLNFTEAGDLLSE